MIVFYGISDKEEKKRRENAFRQKYNIKKNFYLSTMLMELRYLFLFQKSNIGTRENVENEAGSNSFVLHKYTIFMKKI